MELSNLYVDQAGSFDMNLAELELFTTPFEGVLTNFSQTMEHYIQHRYVNASPRVLDTLIKDIIII